MNREDAPLSVKRDLLTFMLAALTTTSSALANDTVARVAAGGITFVKTANIRMLAEDLHISTEHVHVRYRFINESDRAQEATVAFPMPAYSWNSELSEIEQNNRPITTFTATSDGKRVSTSTIRTAWIGDRDVTADLRALGLSDEDIFATFANKNEQGESSLTPAQRNGLRRLNGTGEPDWQVHETLYWAQTFPPHREVVVEHDYVPFVGLAYDEPYQRRFGFVSGSRLHPSSRGSEERTPEEACAGQGAEQEVAQRVQALAKSKPASVDVALRDVEYVLGTGRNWLGPIGDFNLTVEKQRGDDIASLCLPTKVSASDGRRLSFHAHDFVPPDKLVVYFYSVSSSP
jgi:hypothetical protein